jgi:hypothetical protein
LRRGLQGGFKRGRVVLLAVAGGAKVADVQSIGSRGRGLRRLRGSQRWRGCQGYQGTAGGGEGGVAKQTTAGEGLEVHARDFDAAGSSGKHCSVGNR